MKQISTLKNLLLASCVAVAGVANGQVYHPLAFGPFTVGTTTSDPNFYKDYVGVRFMVNSPAVVAGEKVYTFANTGTTPWGGAIPVGAGAINNMQIAMVPAGGDTMALSSYAAHNFDGKVAVVYRGSNEFVCKAVNAQLSGCEALVIVNHSPGGPIGMGAGTVCSTTGITIPVFMISKEDGDAIVQRYRNDDTARITIVPWGVGATNDLGFVPSGGANWHAYAIPSNQLHAGAGNPEAYKMADGAFIANYGTATQTNVTLNINTQFTPTGGSASTVHTNTVTMTAPFPEADSIYALYPTAEYDLTGTGTGRYDIKYNVMSPDMGDDNMADNDITNSFYVTDSLYCKGRYDFTNNKPLSTIGYSFGSGSEFMWGPLYYVKNGGTALSRVQYSLSINGGGALSGEIKIMLYKWTDTSNDGVLQNGELELKSLGLHTLGAPGDTSGAVLNFSDMGNLLGEKTTVMLEADSWYWIAISVPASHFLGSDGIMHPYTRIFGRFHSTANVLDYSSIVALTPDDIAAEPDGAYAAMPATFTSLIGSVDSFNYNNTRGVIPNVAMIANNDPVIAVPHAPVTSNNKLSTFPNPATNQLNVAVDFEKTAKKVTYQVIDNLGRYISTDVHNNVKNENFSLNTSALPAGSYYLLVQADNKLMASPFVIVR